MTTSSDLSARHCTPCAKGTPALDQSSVAQLLRQLPGWQVQGNQISKTYRFENYYQTIAFVNATAWISHQQDHHPDIDIGYNTCTVRYSTHSVGGLSENDFICAAKVQAILPA